jgi:hypothetical protein
MVLQAYPDLRHFALTTLFNCHHAPNLRLLRRSYDTLATWHYRSHPLKLLRDPQHPLKVLFNHQLLPKALLLLLMFQKVLLKYYHETVWLLMTLLLTKNTCIASSGDHFRVTTVVWNIPCRKYEVCLYTCEVQIMKLHVMQFFSNLLLPPPSLAQTSPQHTILQHLSLRLSLNVGDASFTPKITVI